MKGSRKRQFTILAVMLFAFFIAFSGSPKRAFAESPEGDKAITLLKDGEAIGDYATINQVIDKMYDLTKDGSKFKFVVQVNEDIDLTEYSQFGWPYGEVTLKSKDAANPRTIKAKDTNHTMMLGVVNGAQLTVEDIIIDGNNAKRLFWMESTEALPASLTINKGAVLQNGKVEESDQTKIGGGIYCQGAGDLTINGGIIRNNEAIQAGGGIAYIGTRTLTINGGEITGNKVPSESGFGGAIVLQGKGVIKGGKIHGNTAYDGGGIATGKNTNLEITGGEISKNTASYAGGGIYCFKNSEVKLTGGQVSKNEGKYGGGVTAAFNSNFIMEGNGVISENEAYTGGGFYPWGKTPSCDLISGTIEKNKANYGGGIRLRSPKAKIGGVVIQENVANFGGGIYSSLPEGESLTIDGAKLYKNEALSGGGVCLTQGGTLNFKKSEFKENKAYYGGGIWTSNTMTIEKSSFEGNEAIKSEPSILPDGTHENNGHGGAIYVNTALAKDGVVTVDGCTFTGNKADKSGGAISVDETHGLLNVINNTVFDGNEATGELGHGGAIYSNLHAYMPEYDDGSTGPLVQPPTAKDYYYNINTDKTTVFRNNKAFQTFTPPSTKDEFVKLLYQSTSHPGTKYDHPLNNDDVNLIVFKEVIFHKNYETEDPIHDAFLVLEKSKLGKDFPVDPKREGYTFKGWNTQKDGKGTAFTADTVIENDITVYAQWEADPTKPDPNKPDKPIPGGGFYFVPTDTPLLNRKDHAQYMIGYPDQNFKPDNPMSRQEVTVMFSR
ncbi:MAG: InlB B-repeat-containing protein, partial [Aedoeadaptatus pacaensis]